MHHAFKLGDDHHNVELSRAARGYRLHFDGRVVEIDLDAGADGRTWLALGGRRIEVVIACHGDDVFVHLDGEAYALRYQHPLERLAAQAAGSGDDSILAPMPGSIVSVSVQAGDTVTRGQTLLVMESMKMETTIIAPLDGVVAEIAYEPGQTFDRDAVLLKMELPE